MNHSRDSLSEALRQWQVHPAVDPGFRPAVWARIRRKSCESWAAYVGAHRLAWSVVAVMTLILAGAGGHAAARARLDSGREAMAVAYLVELDPRVQAKLRP